MGHEKKKPLGRRDFLRNVAAAGTGATLATPMITPAITPALADSESDDAKRKARYRETDHVKAFYRVNRYPP